MRIIMFLLLFSVIQVMGENSYSQNTRLSLNLKDVSIENVLDEIENQSEFFFLFNQKLVNVDRKIDIDVKNKRIKDILADLFTGEDINCLVMDRQILLSPKYITERVNVIRDRQPQEIVVTGKVTDEEGNSLPGVNIVIKGTITGTISDMDGNYSVEVEDPDAVLVFSFIGFRSQEIAIAGRNVINIILAEEIIGLEEVIAVGYGMKKKVNLTGSVGVITTEKLENRSVVRLEQALQGQVSGLSVIQAGGQPGDELITMQIRGQSTFTSNPILTIVDGIPSSIYQINPNDIESISVLKDASSTAIYGARAAGGVILITTKTGKKGKPQISYNSYVGIQHVTRFPEKVTAYEHATLFIEGQLNDDPNTTSFRYTQEDLDRFSSPDWKDHDWGKEIFQVAPQTQHNISVSGGTDNYNYYLSMGYLFQKGIVMNTSFEKYTFQFNQDIKLSEKLKLSIKGSFIPDERTAPNQLSTKNDGNIIGIVSLMNRVYRWGNHLPFKTSNGDWTTVEGLEPCAIGMASKERGQQILKSNTMRGNFNLDYSITNDLIIKGSYGLITGRSRQRDYAARMKFYDPFDEDRVAWIIEENGLEITNSSNIFQNTQFLTMYEKNFGGHNLSALAGYSQEWYYQDNETSGRKDFITDNIYTIGAGGADPTKWTTDGSASDWALSSFIGRMTYNYNEKYLFEYAMRYDGSSRFIEDRWGFFPSFSAGWRITEEEFLKDNEFLTYLKLRASWGQVGNQNIGNYQFASTLTSGSYYFNGVVQSGVYSKQSPNTQLTWETKTGINIGLDANIKNDLLSITIDVFKERTTDILLDVPVPTTYGIGTPVQNAGIVENIGWELELTHRGSISDFSYGLSFQVSDATNKVIDLLGTGPWKTKVSITEEGHSMYEWYGYKTEGFLQSIEEVNDHSFQNILTSPGDLKYQENGGDPNTITADDRVRLGRSEPRFPFGLTINLNYKGFYLVGFVQGVMSHKTFNNGWTAYNFDRSYATLFKYHLDRWTPETPNALFPKPRIGQRRVNNQFSSFWLQNAAYIRMKNLQVGYNIPKNVISKLKINNARIYVSGENLFTFTKLRGFDPEITTGTTKRLVEKRYPLSKCYYLGININF